VPGGVGVDLVAQEADVVEDLLLAYRALFPAEARLAESLAREGKRLRTSVADQWPALHDHLQLYARGLTRAGVLVLAGAPDEGSRLTGIPFTGPREARERLGLDVVAGDAASPAGAAFWRAAGDAPLPALFGVAHLGHAIPFDAEPAPAVREEAAKHVLGLLALLRPQAVIAVGPDALATLGQAIGQRDLLDLARSPEAAWLERWPPGTPLLRQPRAEAPTRPPFRFRLAPIPSLAGPHSASASDALRSLLNALA